MVSLKSPPASPCTWLSHALSTIRGSDSSHRMGLPFGEAYRVKPTSLRTTCTRSPKFCAQRFSDHAVVYDPAQFSSVLTVANTYCCLPVIPTRSALGFNRYEALSLHPNGLRPGRRPVYTYFGVSPLPKSRLGFSWVVNPCENRNYTCYFVPALLSVPEWGF